MCVNPSADVLPHPLYPIHSSTDNFDPRHQASTHPVVSIISYLRTNHYNADKINLFHLTITAIVMYVETAPMDERPCCLQFDLGLFYWPDSSDVMELLDNDISYVDG